MRSYRCNIVCHILGCMFVLVEFLTQESITSNESEYVNKQESLKKLSSNENAGLQAVAVLGLVHEMNSQSVPHRIYPLHRSQTIFISLPGPRRQNFCPHNVSLRKGKDTLICPITRLPYLAPAPHQPPQSSQEADLLPPSFSHQQSHHAAYCP
jgi:hypothetical protein